MNGGWIGLFSCVLVSSGWSGEPWALHVVDDTSRGADGVRLRDVNGDGLQDLAVGWEEGGVVRAYLHPGRGKERGRWPMVTVGKVPSPEDAVFADLDGDGAVDVVSCCEGKTKTVFAHWAPPVAAGRSTYLMADRWHTTAFGAVRRQAAWMYAVPADVDGEHGVDVIVGSKGGGGGIGWLRSPGQGQAARDTGAWTWQKLQDAGWVMSMAWEDMDGDGDGDLLVSDRRGEARGVFWLANPGAEAVRAGAAWERVPVGAAGTEVLFLDRGDVDGDGFEDVVVAVKRALLGFRALDGTGRRWEAFEVPLPEGVGGGKSVGIGDLDGDGRADLVFSCEGAAGPLSGTRWLRCDGEVGDPSAWEDHEIAGEPGHKYDRVVLHDVDGDGDLDVLCCEERDGLGVFWYENPLGKKL